MTTKVTVDAHAGWAVEVTTIDLNFDATKHETKSTVLPNTKQDFYVHSHRELHIKEMPQATE